MNLLFIKIGLFYGLLSSFSVYDVLTNKKLEVIIEFGNKEQCSTPNVTIQTF